MHKSRLVGFVIDCQTEDLAAAAEFWSKALGMPTRPQEGETYVPLDSGPDGMHIEVQRVDHPSRVHLDIETDDMEAEAQRLEKLGARRVAKIRTWLVMEAPTGQRFCLVRPQRPSGQLPPDSNTWE
jgi:predicted enzyme related to lactoylglutathione lyase